MLHEVLQLSACLKGWCSALIVNSTQIKQKLSPKDAKAQGFRKQRLCACFASLRLCVSSSFWLRFIRIETRGISGLLWDNENIERAGGIHEDQYRLRREAELAQ
ncbi:MAG: hypothetical protein ACREOO_27685 [bacterium]